MDPVKLGSGDNNVQVTTVNVNYEREPKPVEDQNISPRQQNSKQKYENNMTEESLITPQMIDDNEANLKKRIDMCKNIIESLKIELNDEKSRLDKQKVPTPKARALSPDKCTTSTSKGQLSNYLSASHGYLSDKILYKTDNFSDYVDSKLNCDENLMEYEKQLQKYQNTLNMAQIEKKNAIRKQMLAKAYKLKLLEVENQCNIELLRVKQSLQCLEPLKIISNKWKSKTDEKYDMNNYELIPRYPEFHENPVTDSNIVSDDALINQQALVKGGLSSDDIIIPD